MRGAGAGVSMRSVIRTTTSRGVTDFALAGEPGSSPVADGHLFADSHTPHRGGMVRLVAGQGDGVARRARPSGLVQQEVQRHASAVAEAVAQLREQPLVELREMGRGCLRALGELLDQRALLRVEARRGHHVHADAEVAALCAAQRA